MSAITNSLKFQHSHCHPYFSKKFLPYVFYTIFPLIFLLFYLFRFSAADQLSNFTPIYVTSSAFSSSSKEQENEDRVLLPASPPFKAKENGNEVSQPPTLDPEESGNGTEVVQSSSFLPEENGSRNGVLQEGKGTEIPSTCDYTKGNWVQDNRGPLYNGTSCGTIKDGQNCMSHGRSDKGYLHWRWKPMQCNLPRFDPESFLQILQDKHIAFVGDSLARNQLESLVCMLGSISPPNLVYTSGDDNKFRRWHFASHNVIVSIYWSPFLVKGVEKSTDQDPNKLYLDSVDERWASDLDSIDMVVLSIGHWFLLRAVYFDGDTVLGCHANEGVNCTEIGFYDVFGKALNTTLKTIIQRKGLESKGIDVVLTTFSPHHFEGDWDKFGACPKTKPYREGEKVLEGMNDQMRQLAVEAAEKAQVLLSADSNSLSKVRVAALDVTKLSLLRPDGHPGPYMYPFPFANGVGEQVHNDCVHWCLPGPIDTWNEIMLDIVKRWHLPSMR